MAWQAISDDVQKRAEDRPEHAREGDGLHDRLIDHGRAALEPATQRAARTFEPARPRRLPRLMDVSLTNWGMTAPRGSTFTFRAFTGRRQRAQTHWQSERGGHWPPLCVMHGSRSESAARSRSYHFLLAGQPPLPPVSQVRVTTPATFSIV